MARYTEPTEEQLKSWKEWVESRPKSIRKLAERFDPWSLYKMKSTGHLVMVSAFHEDNTLTVLVTADFNVILHERKVFGIDPDDLEPAEIPAQKGMALMTQEQVHENLDALRVTIRPDLWKMGEDGKAVWIGDPNLHPDRDLH